MKIPIDSLFRAFSFGTLVLGLFIVESVILTRLFTDFLDECSEFHQSANNPAGWAVILIGMLVLGLVGWLSRRKLSLWVSWSMTLAATLLMLWAVTPQATC